uniref:Putative deferrochelatase/peroxidase YfeX n=1 Tax=Schistocephalus solidus TaxID=70667 RepID=A0A0V0J6E0_SCHSO
MNRYSRVLSLIRSTLSRRSVATVAGGLGIGSFLYVSSITHKKQYFNLPLANLPSGCAMSVQCASKKTEPQELVIAEDKVHGLFVILHLDRRANRLQCVRALENLKAHIDRISPADIRDDDNEIIMAIGFGPALLKEVYPDASKRGVESFDYKARNFRGGSMPATGGDILIHATCAEYGKLFELSQAIQAEIPEKAIEKTEEVYGFRYRNGRDLSGFIDGTENPADPDERREVAVSKATGGSYVVTQRWLHDFNTIKKQLDTTMEDWIGRTKEDSIEIKPVAVHSHVGRMTAGLSDAEANEKRMVRHSMPYGSVTGEAGLFFIGYSSTPRTLDWMLDRMTGSTPDKTHDSLFNFTKPLTGTFFYVPSQAELRAIFSKCSKY